MSRDHPFTDEWSIYEYLAQNVVHDGDNVVLIDGDERAGKSTLALHLAERASKRIRELVPDAPVFDAERHIILDHEDWERAFDSRQRSATYILDEGGNLMLNRDWSKDENKFLLKILQQMGILNSTFFFCIPDMNYADKYIREHRARVRFWVYREGFSRGFAKLYWRNKHPVWGIQWWDTGIDLRFRRRERDAVWDKYEAKKLSVIHRTVEGHDRHREYLRIRQERRVEKALARQRSPQKEKVLAN